MKNLFNKTVSLLLLITALIITPIKGYALNSSIINQHFLVAQQKSVINYEKSQPSAIDNPVVDPNFNVMRKSSIDSSFAATIIVVLVLIASIVPLFNWYLSKSKTN